MYILKRKKCPPAKLYVDCKIILKWLLKPVFEEVEFTRVFQNRNQWLVLQIVVMNFQVLEKEGDLLSTSRKGRRFIEYLSDCYSVK